MYTHCTQSQGWTSEIVLGGWVGGIVVVYVEGKGQKEGRAGEGGGGVEGGKVLITEGGGGVQNGKFVVFENVCTSRP